MKNGLLMLLLALRFVVLPAQSLHTGGTVPGFALKNVDGKMVSLADYQQAKGFIIVFTCNHCPFARLYTQRLNDLARQYGPKGFVLLAVNSSDNVLLQGESFGKMVEQARSQHYSFPYLQDAEQTVARSFGANRTPQAFVLLKENGKLVIKYEGAVDDNGAEAAQVAHHYLADALNNLLNSKPVAVTDTKAVGCAIKFKGTL